MQKKNTNQDKEKIKVLYCRVSSISQKLDSQKENSGYYNLIFEEKVSGLVPFFARKEGAKIQKMIAEGVRFDLYVSHVDRLGRDPLDILSLIRLCTLHGINIIFTKQNLQTLDQDGYENPVDKFTISILLTVAELSRAQQLSVAKTGINIARKKNPNFYPGRKKGSKENTNLFFSKPKNAIALNLLKEGFYKCKEIAKLSGLHPNSISKIKRIWQSEQRKDGSISRTQL